MKKYYKYFSSGITASVEEHRNGTATLRIYFWDKTKVKKYKNFKSAYNAWWRL